MQLNDEQRSAVESADGPVLVIAPAGTGKTRVLTERIIYLIQERKIQPQSILAVTFTNLAGNEMKERLSQRLDKDQLPTFVGTLHGICWEILNNYKHKLPDLGWTKPTFELLSEEFYAGLIANLVQKNYKKQQKCSFSFLGDIVRAIGKIKIESGLYGKFSEEIFNVVAQEVFDGYVKDLNARSAFDFDDLLIYTYKLLKNYDDIRFEYSHRFTHVLVDEVQDLNELEYQLINLFFPEDKRTNFFAVGDPNQCIYIFKGAKENIFKEYESKFKGDVRIFSLVKNYRSGTSIVSLANSLQRFPCNVVANTEETGTVVEFSDPLDIGPFIDANFVEKDLSKWAILFRKHSVIYPWIIALIKKKINFRVSKFDLLNNEVINNLVYLMKAVYSSTNEELISYLWSSNYLRNTNDLSVLTDMAKKYDLFTRECWVNFPVISKATKNKLESLLKDIEAIRRGKTVNSLYILAFSIFRTKIYPFHPYSEKCRESLFLFFQWLDNIQTEKTFESSKEIISNLDDYWSIPKETIHKKEHDFLVLSTIYRVKGLEWDNVLVLKYKDLVREKHIEDSEDKHLAYVAVTRAKRKLCLEGKVIHGST